MPRYCLFVSGSEACGEPQGLDATTFEASDLERALEALEIPGAQIQELRLYGRSYCLDRYGNPRTIELRQEC